MKQKIKCFFITVFIIAIYCVHVHASDSMLKWDASTGDVTGYTIYYGLSQGSYPFSEDVGNVTQYSLNNFSLSEGTTYYFVVRAYNAAGESGDSNVTSYAVPSAGDTTPPVPPEGVSGEIVNEDILLTWQANSENDISGYRVYYGTSSRNYGLPIPENGTEYSITGLNSGVTYYFAVSAVDTSGNESGYSSPEIIKTISVADTTSPSVFIESPTDSPLFDTSSLSIDISGSASDDRSVTQIVWSNSAGGSGVAAGTDSWSISDIGLVEGDNVITITAKDAAGNESTDTITVTNTLGSLRTKVFGAVSGADFPQTCEDTFLNAGSASTNTSNSSVSLNTYTWPTDTAANRIAMNWDVSILPQNAVVLKAKLSLYMFGYDGTGGDAGYEITAHKIINHKPGISTCTWNTYNGTNTWTGGNNGGELDLAPAEVGVIVDKTVGYKEFDITNMVKGWIIDPSGNFGLMLNS
ncbi:MAG: fibronectin type III domain-containing protein, partial [Desulfobacula sp.]|uniref:fibronectin type III domain-containing protein n=1 Tax=Desulfobacula sp. TaxID=2593537 RepID=UPI0025B7D8F9